ncbi:MAG: FHIPEP family type III secretion protein, partial [bacterium]
SSEWEKALDDSCQRTELGTMFMLNPLQVQELIETTASTLMRAHQIIGQQPVVLCSPRIRLPLYQLLERHIPTIVVISYSELITDIKVEAIDTIGEGEFVS